MDNEQELDSVRGIGIYWHATYNIPFGKNKLATLCKYSISSIHRMKGTDLVDCPNCLKRIKKESKE